MRRFILMPSLLIILCLPASVAAQHSYKFDSPVQIAGITYDVRPQSLGIAWSGEVFGVVFDDYWHDKSSNTAYFMLVNKNGKSVAGPIKLARKQYVMDPRICWGEDSFLILYNAGRRKGKNTWKLNYYVARFDEKGKKLGEEKLDGLPIDDNSGLYTKVLWSGKAFYAVYYGEPVWTNLTSSLNICKVGSDGIPGQSTVLLGDELTFWDIAWDGQQFIYADLFSVRNGAMKTQIRTFMFDDQGETVAKETFVTSIPADSYQGISIIPTHRKNRYLLAFGVLRPSNNASPTEMHWYDVYAATIKVRKGKFKSLKPRIISLNQPYDWSFPTLLRDGKNYYITAMLTASGCSNAFARINAKGKIISSPLMRMVPGPGCGAWPPYPALAGKECAWVFCEGGVYFQIIRQ